MENTVYNKKLFLLDMDGTLYLDNDLFEGVHEFLAYIKEIGGRYLFFTNNSSKNVSKYVEKLNRLGISATSDDFITSTEATVFYLKKKNHKLIYPMGTASFCEALVSAGLPITDKYDENTDCVCLAYDSELTYSKLQIVSKLLTLFDVDYIATNPDYVCPTDFGYVPDCGSFADMLYNATKKRPFFIGKPNTLMVELAIEKTGYKKEEAVMIGDRIYTDIACGVNSGIGSLLVWSGEATPKDLEESPVKPDFIYNNVNELYLDLKKHRAL
ncbi:MAG: HAD-IIA family hydrolase [Ruminococcaceae bacterium]|nr:HAD-IIA family hydrolase [Oscillospiraceae bacterium]